VLRLLEVFKAAVEVFKAVVEVFRLLSRCQSRRQGVKAAVLYSYTSVGIKGIR
jgi:hypothetical protein